MQNNLYVYIQLPSNLKTQIYKISINKTIKKIVKN